MNAVDMYIVTTLLLVGGWALSLAGNYYFSKYSRMDIHFTLDEKEIAARAKISKRGRVFTYAGIVLILLSVVLGIILTTHFLNLILV